MNQGESGITVLKQPPDYKPTNPSYGSTLDVVGEADAKCVPLAGDAHGHINIPLLSFAPLLQLHLLSPWLIHCLHNPPQPPRNKQRGENSFGHSHFLAAPQRKEKVFFFFC